MQKFERVHYVLLGVTQRFVTKTIICITLIAMMQSVDAIAFEISAQKTTNQKALAQEIALQQTKNKNNCDTSYALSSCVKPNFSEDYYIEQSILYFRTMESSVSPFVQPNYADDVVRWEWPPWLWLTGYGRVNLIWTDVLLKLFPTSYDKIDCRAFASQPFGRCHVVFNYGGHLCPIYEEFSFNDVGEITFIEAWSDYPSLLPMNEEDTWAEGDNIKRLANKIPGLGYAEGAIDIHLAQLIKVSEQDEDIKNLTTRLKAPYSAYIKALREHEGEIMKGCDAPEEIEN